MTFSNTIAHEVEAAWAEHLEEVAKYTEPHGVLRGYARSGFMAGWHARDAEVADLRHQLTLFARSQGMRAEWPDETGTKGA